MRARKAGFWVTLVLSGFVASGFVGCGGKDDASETTTNADAGRSVGTCGNGKIDGDEQCDGTDTGLETCASATMGLQPTGTLGCLPTCTFDTKNCSGTGAGGTSGSGATSGAGATTGAGATRGGGATTGFGGTGQGGGFGGPGRGRGNGNGNGATAGAAQ